MNRILSSLIAVWFLCCGFSPDSSVWERMPDGIREGQVKSVVVLDDVSDGILAATDRGIYRAEGPRSFFRQVLAFPPGQTVLYSLYIDGGWVAAATNQGVWESDDSGLHWKYFFNPSDELHSRCYAVFRSGDSIFIGTAEGVFRKDRIGSEWYRHRGVLGEEPVYAIVGNDQYVFFAAGDGIYREGIDLHTPAEKIFFISSDLSSSVDLFYDEEESLDHFDDRFLRSLSYDLDSGALIAAADNGFWISHDDGGSWNSVLSNGVFPGESEKILFCRSCLTSHGQRAPDIQNRDGHSEPEPILFLASRKGVFLFSDKKWHELYRGLTVKTIHDVFIDKKGRVFAGTASGLFMLTVAQKLTADYRYIKDAWQHEPSVQEVHKMVTFYADVGKEKTDSWKVLSRRKAVLPSVSWQMQRDVGDSYHWDSGQNPDVLQQGVDALDWSVTLKWELSDLIWSTAQTSIDTRSKIMVELREDLLAQATRIYFERRRLQAESMQMSDDAPEQWQIQLRIDELTAGLDAMTGGGFSRNILK